MLIVFQLDVPVGAWLERKGRVVVPRPERCPACRHGRLTFAGWRPRVTRWGKVWLQRVRCGRADAHEDGQDKTHSLVPNVLVSGRMDLATVIGWALEANAAGLGWRRIAGRLGEQLLSPSTVRRWLRAARDRGPWVAGRLLADAAAADPSSRAPPGGGPVAMVVAAATAAAAAFTVLSGETTSRWRHAVVVTGGRLLW